MRKAEQSFLIGFLPGLFFDLEDGGYKFFWNVNLQSLDYLMLYLTSFLHVIHPAHKQLVFTIIK
jgi:hypothetical protein